MAPLALTGLVHDGCAAALAGESDQAHQARAAKTNVDVSGTVARAAGAVTVVYGTWLNLLAARMAKMASLSTSSSPSKSPVAHPARQFAELLTY